MCEAIALLVKLKSLENHSEPQMRKMRNLQMIVYARPGAEEGLGGSAPQPQYNGSRTLPTNKKKKNVFIKFPQNATRIPSGTTPQRRLQTPSSIFGPRRGYVCGSVPPEIESQLRAWFMHSNHWAADAKMDSEGYKIKLVGVVDIVFPNKQLRYHWIFIYNYVFGSQTPKLLSLAK